MSDGYDCRHARLAIGGDPRHLPPEAESHIAGCAACSNFLAETLGMDERLREALELPLHQFRAAPARPAAPGRLAMAASLLLAVMVAGGVWMFWPQPALAREVIEHVRHEPDSWMAQRLLTAEELAPILAKAGVELDTSLPVVYASPCPFRGHVVPHLVVQTDDGPMTVMVLEHEKVSSRRDFNEGEYHGLLLPAGAGGVAVLKRGGAASDADVSRVLSAVR